MTTSAAATDVEYSETDYDSVQLYLGYPSSYWLNFGISWSPILIIFVFLFIITKAQKKRYNEAVVKQNFMIERQKDSLTTLQSIDAVLKEISQKLDKK